MDGGYPRSHFPTIVSRVLVRGGSLMNHIDALDRRTQARLLRLRELYGVDDWAATSPTTGHDSAGTLSLTVDPTQQIIDVKVIRLDAVLRDPVGLNTAVSEARAMAELIRADECARLSPDAAELEQLGQDFMAGRYTVTLPDPPSTRPPGGRSYEASDTSRRLTQEEVPRHKHVGEVQKRSANGDIVVTFDTLGRPMQVMTDAAWLSETTSAELERALRETLIPDQEDGR